MRKALQLISLLALVMTIVPSVMFIRGSIDLENVKTLMFGTALVWFVVTPFWMGREKSEG